VDEPVDGGERVAIAKAGDDGGVAGFGLVGHDGKSVTCWARVSWKKRRSRLGARGGYPPPPWHKSLVFIGLRGARVCKNVIIKGLRLNSAKQTS
jgi:hypothetical protein